MDITQTALLLNLRISCWIATRHDSKVSSEVADQHGTSATRAGRYNKNVIDHKAPSYEGVWKAVNRLRTFHYRYTLPWGDGAQIISADAYPQYAADFRALKGSFNEAADAFCKDFPELRDRARNELNGLYKEEDYPNEKFLREKFAVSLACLPVPAENDFRVQLSGDQVAEIKQSITDDVSNSLATAMKAAWDRLHKAISHTREKLADKDAKFKDSLVDNLARECKILSKLNIVKDPQLDELRVGAESMVKGLTATALRDDKKLRKTTADKAAAIEAKFKALRYAI